MPCALGIAPIAQDRDQRVSESEVLINLAYQQEPGIGEEASALEIEQDGLVVNRINEESLS